MHGMMMNRPLRIADIITLAEKIHPNEQIISKTLFGCPKQISNKIVAVVISLLCKLGRARIIDFDRDILGLLEAWVMWQALEGA